MAEYGEELVEVIKEAKATPALPPQSRRREVDDAERERETGKDWRRGEAKAVTPCRWCCRPRPSSTSSSTASMAWTLPRSCTRMGLYAAQAARADLQS